MNPHLQQALGHAQTASAYLELVALELERAATAGERLDPHTYRSMAAALRDAGRGLADAGADVCAAITRTQRDLASVRRGEQLADRTAEHTRGLDVACEMPGGVRRGPKLTD